MILENKLNISYLYEGYVFLEIAEFEDIVKILKEFKRILKKDGYIIFITSIVTDIKDKWVSL